MVNQSSASQGLPHRICQASAISSGDPKPRMVRSTCGAREGPAPRFTAASSTAKHKATCSASRSTVCARNWPVTCHRAGGGAMVVVDQVVGAMVEPW